MTPTPHGNNDTQREGKRAALDSSNPGLRQKNLPVKKSPIGTKPEAWRPGSRRPGVATGLATVSLG